MTQLCALPGCRQRNRHLPGCVDDCLGCLPRATEEGIVCDSCLDLMRFKLQFIANQTPTARLVVAGQVRNGAGGPGGKPGSRPPLNVDALDALDAIQNALTTMAREIADERGLTFGTDGRSDRLRWPLTAERAELVGRDTPDPAERTTT